MKDAASTAQPAKRLSTPTKNIRRHALDRAKVFIQPLDAKGPKRRSPACWRRTAPPMARSRRSARATAARAICCSAYWAASPYLTDLSARDPARLARILTSDPAQRIEALIDRNARTSKPKTKPS